MSWGPCFFYYRCPDCGRQFKYASDLIPIFGDWFGRCPHCGVQGDYVYDGARTPDDADYFEVDDD